MFLLKERDQLALLETCHRRHHHRHPLFLILIPPQCYSYSYNHLAELIYCNWAWDNCSRCLVRSSPVYMAVLKQNLRPFRINLTLVDVPVLDYNSILISLACIQFRFPFRCMNSNWDQNKNRNQNQIDAWSSNFACALFIHLTSNNDDNNHCDDNADKRIEQKRVKFQPVHEIPTLISNSRIGISFWFWFWCRFWFWF